MIFNGIIMWYSFEAHLLSSYMICQLYIWNYLCESFHTLSKYFSKYIDISLEDIKIPITLFQSTINILSLKISIVPGNGNCTNRMFTSFGISLKCNEFLKFIVLTPLSMIFFDF